MNYKIAAPLLLNPGPSAAKDAGRFTEFANRARATMSKFKMPNMHPAFGEAAIGAGVGGAAGYALADEDKKWQGAGVGAGVGAGTAAVLGHVGRVSNKAFDANANILNKNTAATAQEKYEAMQDVVKPSTMSDERVYEDVFSGREKFRKSVKTYVDDKEKWFKRKDHEMNAMNRESAKGKYRDVRSDIRNTEDILNMGRTLNGDDMATDMANRQKLDNYRDNFVRPKDTVDNASKYNGKIFGGFRASKANAQAMGDAIKHHSNMANETNDIGMNLQVSNMFSGISFGRKSPLRAASHEEIEAVGKTQAYKDRYNAAVRGATKDFRAGTKGKHFEDNFQQQTQGTSHDIHLQDHKDTLGMTDMQFETKKQVDKHIRNMQRKHHPDLGGDPEKSMKVNDAGAGIKNTTWYEKLAAFNLARLGEAAVGAGLGGAAGYGLSDDKNKWRNAAMGAGVGAGVAVGANRLALKGVKRVDGEINNVYAEAKVKAKASYDRHSAKYNAADRGDSAVSKSVYDKKTYARGSADTNARYSDNKEEFRKGTAFTRENFTNAVRDKDFMGLRGSAHGTRLAEDIASRETLKDFKTNYVDNMASSNVHGEARTKMFGGLRSGKRLGESWNDAMDYSNGVNRRTSSMDGNALSNAFGNRLHGNNNYNVADSDAVAAASKTQEYKDRFGAAARQGTRDARKDTHAQFTQEKAKRAENKRKNDEEWEKFRKSWEDAFNSKYNTGSSRNTGGGAGQRRTSYDDISAHKDTLGMTGMQFETKKQVDKHIRRVQRDNHPDLGGSEEKMKQVNNANDAIRSSSWYEKLARYQGAYLNW